jgi:DNA-binding CsgD family transcriptional regulator
MRHTAIGVIAIGTVIANLFLAVAWPLAFIAGGLVLVFGEFAPRLLPRPRPAAKPPSPATYPLSRAEVPVAILVAKGRTNKAIADQIFRSERTVDNHVTHIYTKLNINSRAELAIWVRDHGLLSEESSPKSTPPKPGRQ